MAVATGDGDHGKEKEKTTFVQSVVELLRQRARRARNIFHDDEHRQTGKATSGVC